MAGDWIKMRTDLHTDPAVIGIACAAGINEDEVVGKLHRIWSWADSHTVDGNAPSVSVSWIDRYLSVSGFAKAMCDVGWLSCQCDDGQVGVRFPNFDRHNGKTAKTRALTAKRVSKHKEKSNADSVSKVTLSALAREEKRREEKIDTNTGANSSHDEATEPKPEPYPEDFERLWKAWPRRENKRSAFKAYKTAKKRKPAADILEAANALAASPKGKGNYCPHLASWLNADGWADDRAAWQRSGENANGQSRPAPNIKIVSLPTVNPKHLAEQQRLDREAAEKAKTQQ